MQIQELFHIWRPTLPIFQLECLDEGSQGRLSPLLKKQDIGSSHHGNLRSLSSIKFSIYGGQSDGFPCLLNDYSTEAMTNEN